MCQRLLPNVGCQGLKPVVQVESWRKDQNTLDIFPPQNVQMVAFTVNSSSSYYSFFLVSENYCFFARTGLEEIARGFNRVPQQILIFRTGMK